MLNISDKGNVNPTKSIYFVLSTHLNYDCCMLMSSSRADFTKKNI